MKPIKLLIILFIIGIISALGVYLYVFHKPHRNVAHEKPAYIMSAKDILNEFTNDETSAYEKYGDQVIQLDGDIVDISISDNSASITLVDEMAGINCGFDSVSIVKTGIETLHNLKVGDLVTIKGKCDGYDMIMGVVLTRSIVIEPEDK